MNKCNLYCNTNYIKLNPLKTEYLISGDSQLPNKYFYLSDHKINVNERLKHLGFIWDTQRSKFASMENINIDNRISEFKAIISTLIRAGIRFSHPRSITQIFSTIAIPKLTYGLELCKITKELTTKLNIIGRSALKSLFSISKFSKNLLNSFFNIDNVSTVVLRNKLNLFVRLMNNPVTSKLILSQLQHQTYENSLIYEILQICQDYNIDFFQLLLSSKKQIINETFQDIPPNILDQLNTAICFWHVKEQREIFRNIMEENIPPAYDYYYFFLTFIYITRFYYKVYGVE